MTRWGTVLSVGTARGDSGHWQKSCLEQQPAGSTSASAPAPASQAGSGYGCSSGRREVWQDGYGKVWGQTDQQPSNLGVFGAWQDFFQRLSSAHRASRQLLISEQAEHLPLPWDFAISSVKFQLEQKHFRRPCSVLEFTDVKWREWGKEIWTNGLLFHNSDCFSTLWITRPEE